MFGYTEHAVLAKGIEDFGFVAPEDLPGVRDTIAQLENLATTTLISTQSQHARRR